MEGCLKDSAGISVRAAASQRGVRTRSARGGVGAGEL